MSMVDHLYFHAVQLTLIWVSLMILKDSASLKQTCFFFGCPVDCEFNFITSKGIIKGWSPSSICFVVLTVAEADWIPLKVMSCEIKVPF